MGNTYDLRFSRKCYYVCLGICILLGSAYLVLAALDISFKDIYPYPCFLYVLCGLYCPGCGGTRSVTFLLQGDFIRSFIYHPAVPYTAVLVGCYIISHTLNIITRGKVKAMLFRPIYFYILIGVILLQWIVKNIIILTTGTYLPGQ